MRVIYSGANYCGPQTFKRLLLLADEIAFNDRPSVTFGGWGSVGVASPVRQILPAYKWNVELNRIAAGLDAIDPAAVQTELPRLMAAEIALKIEQYREEMRAAADRMYGNLLKRFVAAPVPALLVAALGSMNLIQAAGTFAAGLVPVMAPPVIDYIQARTAGKRRHAISYLVDLAN